MSKCNKCERTTQVVYLEFGEPLCAACQTEAYLDRVTSQFVSTMGFNDEPRTDRTMSETFMKGGA